MATWHALLEWRRAHSRRMEDGEWRELLLLHRWRMENEKTSHAKFYFFHPGLLLSPWSLLTLLLRGSSSFLWFLCSLGATAHWNSPFFKTSKLHICIVIVHLCGFDISGLKKFMLSSELGWYKVVEISRIGHLTLKAHHNIADPALILGSCMVKAGYKGQVKGELQIGKLGRLSPCAILTSQTCRFISYIINTDLTIDFKLQYWISAYYT